MILDIEVRGIGDWLSRLNPGRLAEAKRAILRAVGEALRQRLARYPGPSHQPVIWKSDAQRRAYFAKAAGDVPYRRQQSAMSERLGPSWTAVVRDDNEAIVGTRVSYARFVQSAEAQQPQHAATGWITDAQAIAELEASGDIEEIANQALTAWIGG